MPHTAHGRVQALCWCPAWAPAAAVHGRFAVREGHVGQAELRVRVLQAICYERGAVVHNQEATAAHMGMEVLFFCRAGLSDMPFVDGPLPAGLNGACSAIV